MSNENLVNLVDLVIRLAKEERQADINAGMCGTRADWRDAEEAEEKLEEGRSKLIKALGATTGLN
jgi:hypothetical protein